jgi:hypothetical protein
MPVTKVSATELLGGKALVMPATPHLEKLREHQGRSEKPKSA